MHFLEYYYKSIIKHDFINKFNYSNNDNIPKFKKIILNFNNKDTKIKTFVMVLLSLELISSKTGVLTTTKKPNIFLKLRKGQPIGCKVVLKKKHMYLFLEKLLMDIVPQLQINKTTNSISFKLTKKKLKFSEISEHYDLLNIIPKLDITLVTNSKNYNELLFLLKSFQFQVN